jgi:hypothetical protein
MKKPEPYMLKEIVLYFCTVFGVLMSPFIPYLVSIIIYADIPLIPWSMYHPIRIAAILFVALLMTFMIERDDPNGDVAKSKAGKSKNFRKRIIQHLAYGALWSSFLESIMEGVTR